MNPSMYMIAFSIFFGLCIFLVACSALAVIKFLIEVFT